jgi:hypothetical protein
MTSTKQSKRFQSGREAFKAYAPNSPISERNPVPNAYGEDEADVQLVVDDVVRQFRSAAAELKNRRKSDPA